MLCTEFAPLLKVTFEIYLTKFSIFNEIKTVSIKYFTQLRLRLHFYFCIGNNFKSKNLFGFFFLVLNIFLSIKKKFFFSLFLKSKVAKHKTVDG